jgi:hypothetical protein
MGCGARLPFKIVASFPIEAAAGNDDDDDDSDVNGAVDDDMGRGDEISIIDPEADNDDLAWEDRAWSDERLTTSPSTTISVAKLSEGNLDGEAGGWGCGPSFCEKEEETEKEEEESDVDEEVEGKENGVVVVGESFAYVAVSFFFHSSI